MYSLTVISLSLKTRLYSNSQFLPLSTFVGWYCTCGGGGGSKNSHHLRQGYIPIVCSLDHWIIFWMIQPFSPWMMVTRNKKQERQTKQKEERLLGGKKEQSLFSSFLPISTVYLLFGCCVYQACRGQMSFLSLSLSLSFSLSLPFLSLMLRVIWVIKFLSLLVLLYFLYVITWTNEMDIFLHLKEKHKKWS